MGANGRVLMQAWAFEAASCPTRPNEVKKTKLQNNTSPQACICIVCAPSMGEGIERYRIIPEGVNPLQASWRSLLVPLKSWIVDKLEISRPLITSFRDGAISGR